MRILLIQAHPRRGSLIHAMGRGAASVLLGNGHDVLSHDLYEEGFDPVVAEEEVADRRIGDTVVHRHSRDLSRADGIIILHPVWWGQPPAIIKGWVDRVFRPGVAYDARYGGGLLRARSALVFATSNQRNTARPGILLDMLWKESVLRMCGVKDVSVTVFGPAQSSTPQMRSHWLALARGKVDECFPSQEGTAAHSTGAFAG